MLVQAPPAHSLPLISSADTCYVLSFAIIMLNTSLHNPNVRDKPPVERFISMNRGINEGGDLPEELLRVRASFPNYNTRRDATERLCSQERLQRV